MSMCFGRLTRTCGIPNGHQSLSAAGGGSRNTGTSLPPKSVPFDGAGRGLPRCRKARRLNSQAEIAVAEMPPKANRASPNFRSIQFEAILYSGFHRPQRVEEQ